MQLESRAAGTYPLTRRFGTITIDLYPSGFRITTIWLRGFTRNPRTITIENPVSRTFVERPMSVVGDIIRFIGGHPVNAGPPDSIRVMSGRVGGLTARRHRLAYPREVFDVWTTAALGPTPAFRAFAEELVKAVAPRAVVALRSVPDTPIYVERERQPLLHPKRMVWNAAGEAEALRVSPWMFPAPFGTIFK